jgi:hypothetical protein
MNLNHHYRFLGSGVVYFVSLVDYSYALKKVTVICTETLEHVYENTHDVLEIREPPISYGVQCSPNRWQKSTLICSVDKIYTSDHYIMDVTSAVRPDLGPIQPQV